MRTAEPVKVECLCVYLRGIKIGVAVNSVEHIGDFRLTPAPPLSHDWIVGLGTHAGQTFVAVDPSTSSRRDRKRSRRACKCLVVAKQPGSALWAVQVERLGDVQVLDVSPSTRVSLPEWNSPKAWVAEAQAADREGIPFLHLGQIAAEFEATPTSRWLTETEALQDADSSCPAQ